MDACTDALFPFLPEKHREASLLGRRIFAAAFFPNFLKLLLTNRGKAYMM